MTDSTLTRDQALALMRKLASDDDFRTLFEAKPAKALHTLGVAPEVILDLKASCLERARLVSKERFSEAVWTLDEVVLQQAAGMQPPQMTLAQNDDQRGHGRMQTSRVLPGMRRMSVS